MKGGGDVHPVSPIDACGAVILRYSEGSGLFRVDSQNASGYLSMTCRRGLGTGGEGVGCFMCPPVQRAAPGCNPSLLYLGASLPPLLTAELRRKVDQITGKSPASYRASAPG